MSLVLTMMADPAGRKLGDGDVLALRDVLRALGCVVGEADWLAPGIACDLPFEGAEPETAEGVTREALGQAPFDVAAQPLAGRRKGLLIADMESTIIAEEMLDELAETLGIRDEIAAVTAAAMRGELDFESALEARVAKLAGMPVDVLEAAAERITLNPGARSLISTLARAGVPTALVSGGFTVFTGKVAVLCGFDSHQSNQLESAEGRLTGRVLKPILGREAKLEALRRLAREQGLDESGVCAVGDGANDLAMLRAAGLGVAYRAKPAVREAARFSLDHADLTGLLYMQGYRAREIV